MVIRWIDSFSIFLELPSVKQSLTELIRRQQAGRPLEDSEPIPLIERKQGHWLGRSTYLDHRDFHPYLSRFTIIGRFNGSTT